jgi:prepilin-type N-terminal cleavage/methylation domain-containing protein
MKSFKKQAGFTLVEIAIVLVIVGLLLAGVLKGQELIENSRIKAIVTDMRAVQAAVNGYQDRYRAIPGDETLATMAARGWGASAAAGGGNADGVLGITAAQAFTNAGEQRAFWRALRASGLIAGEPLGAAGAAGLPRHSAGGLMGVTADATGVYGQRGMSVCVAGLNARQAAGVDSLVDGPLPATQIGNDRGDVRGATGAANPLAPVAGAVAPVGVAYDETGVTGWTLCMRM